MQAPLRVLEALKTKYRHASRAVDDSFQATKNLFEKHNVVFTVAGGLLSAGAAWAGYTARQIHQKKLEEKLQKIEEHMTNVYSLEEQQVKALTTAAARTGVSYKAFFATSSTALIIGYALGFRGGRRFVIRRIPPDLLLAAKKHRSSNRLSRFLPGKPEPAKESPVPTANPFAAATASGQTDAQTSKSADGRNGASGSNNRLLRVLPGSPDPAKESPEPTSQPVTAATSYGQPDAQGSKSADVSNGASSSGAESNGPGENEQRSDVSTGDASTSGRQELDPAGNMQFGARDLKDRNRHGGASRNGVDAALGETGFERQFERVMRPEREAVGESPEALDDILHATIPNLNGGSDTDGGEGVAASEEDGEGAESEQPESSFSLGGEVGGARDERRPGAVIERGDSQKERRTDEEQGEHRSSQAPLADDVKQ